MVLTASDHTAEFGKYAAEIQPTWLQMQGELAALSGPVGRASDVGGPEVRTAAEFARAYFEAAGRSWRVVEVPVPGKMARAWRQGAQVAPDHKYGRTTWEEFLGRTLHASNTDGSTRKELA